MAERLKVIDRDDLVRDAHSKAVLSTDLKKLHAHREKRRLLVGVQSQQDQINELKREVTEIKTMLEKILTAVSDK